MPHHRVRQSLIITPRVPRPVMQVCVCLLMLLIVLPWTAPFQTCTIGDLLGAASHHHVGTHHAVVSPMLRAGTRRLGEELLVLLGPASDAAEAIIPLPLDEAKRLKPVAIVSPLRRDEAVQATHTAAVRPAQSGHAARTAVLRI
jgi:hypothetical protein